MPCLCAWPRPPWEPPFLPPSNLSFLWETRQNFVDSLLDSHPFLPLDVSISNSIKILHQHKVQRINMSARSKSLKPVATAAHPSGLLPSWTTQPLVSISAISFCFRGTVWVFACLHQISRVYENRATAWRYIYLKITGLLENHFQGSSSSSLIGLTLCSLCYSFSGVYEFFIPPTSALCLAPSLFLLLYNYHLNSPVGPDPLSSTSLMVTMVREKCLGAPGPYITFQAALLPVRPHLTREGNWGIG